MAAVDHHNTDNPHAHLLVGAHERGKALLIDRTTCGAEYAPQPG